MKNYLRHSINLAEATMDGNKADEQDIEGLLDLSFDRYFSTSGLFGTPESCIPIIDELQKFGIYEVACLIDFGIDTTTILNNLPHLGKLLQLHIESKR